MLKCMHQKTGYKSNNSKYEPFNSSDNVNVIEVRDYKTDLNPVSVTDIDITKSNVFVSIHEN